MEDLKMQLFEYDGLKFIEKDDLIVGILKSKKNGFEKQTTDWVMSNLQNGKTFVDVGHSTGWFSLHAASKGFKVIGFEPMNIAFKRATENMRLNGLNYDIHNMAASDTNGETKIHFNPSVAITTGASLVSSIRSHVNTGSAVIRTVRLDEFLKDEPIGIMKIDVEGHELAVLDGSKNIIAKNKPKLVLEANDDHHEKLLSDWLKKNSYTYKMVDERNMLCSYVEMA
jgi:FkbM family methyltransferase